MSVPIPLSEEELKLPDCYSHFGPRAQFREPPRPGDHVHVHLKAGFAIVGEVEHTTSSALVAKVSKVLCKPNAQIHGWAPGSLFTLALDHVRLISRRHIAGRRQTQR